ncbi:hypothetical protein [Acaryochloris sp. IP29b_bin.148]|uniref:hypothetical protein n=1 Tax=Acaryochloris sp. IP29b_bin.148 TaxID=2969218 RepID=UPI0026106EA8|nr:hypothetical protein [Acaryochloris sp. IP29b_bin.148]
MLRLKSALIIGLLSALSLTACSEAGDTVKDAADKAKDTAAETTDKVTDTAADATDKVKDTATDAKDAVTETVNKGTDLVALKDSVSGMKDGVTSTLDAAKSGDFETAKTEFAKVQDAWPALKENIKPDSAQSIQDGIETVKTSLGEGEPNQDKVVSGLQDLLKSVTSIKLG